MPRKPLDPNTLKPGGPGVRSPEAQKFLDAIDEMRGSGDFDWADDTLRGIYDSVEGSNHHTDGQVRAINNIRSSRGYGEVEL